MYVRSDSPIPQNGMLPPPAACVDASNAAIELARCVSTAGRMIAYGTVPTYESLRAISPGVEESASIMLPASELARRSILTGAAPAAKPARVLPGRRAPVVVPLSFVPHDQTSTCVDLPVPETAVLEQRPVMPARAPGDYTARRYFGRLASGMTGYAPVWGDATKRAADTNLSGDDAGGVLGWMRRNPWLTFGLLAAGVAVGVSQSGDSRRF